MISHQLAVQIAQSTIGSGDDPVAAIAATVINLLSGIQRILIDVGGAIVVLSIIFAGYKYITGDPKGGKAALIAAVTGTAIVLLSYTIIGIVCNSGGLSCS